MFRPKTYPICDDYIVTDISLGEGANGKVVECIHKQTQVKYALKRLKDSPKARREVDIITELAKAAQTSCN